MTEQWTHRDYIGRLQLKQSTAFIMAATPSPTPNSTDSRSATLLVSTASSSLASIPSQRFGVVESDYAGTAASRQTQQMTVDSCTGGLSEFDAFSIDGESACGEIAPVMDYELTATPPRYVAGNSFFNFELYGSLRKGGAVTLLTPRYVGYAVSAALSGYVLAATMNVLLKMAPERLGVSSTDDIRAVLSLQWWLVLPLGYVSDSFAPFCLRRKPYMILGWILAAVSWFLLFVFFKFSSAIFSSTLPPPQATTACITLATCGLVIATNALDIRIVELSQQEELHIRGRLLGAYQCIKLGATIVLYLIMNLSTTTQHDGFNNYLSLPSVSYYALHLAVLSLLSIPFLLLFAHEERLNETLAAPQFRRAWKRFWQSAQQRAIWQLVVFNCLLWFFTKFDYAELDHAIGFWCHDNASDNLAAYAVSDAALGALLVFWSIYGINLSWTCTATWIVISWCLVSFTGHTLVAFGIGRSAWMIYGLYVLEAGVRALLLLSAFVPTIEVAQFGIEGIVYGILNSFQSIVKLLGIQIEIAVVAALPSLRFTEDEVRASSSSTQWRAFWGVLAMTGIMLCSLIGLCFLPRQKLDAQQLRVYGGYSRTAVILLSIGFLAGFVYTSYREWYELYSHNHGGGDSHPAPKQ